MVEFYAKKIKEAKEKGVSYYTVKNIKDGSSKLVKVIPYDGQELHNGGTGCGNLIIADRGKLKLVFYTTKDTGKRFRTFGNPTFYFGKRQIRAIIEYEDM